MLNSINPWIITLWLNHRIIWDLWNCNWPGLGLDGKADRRVGGRPKFESLGYLGTIGFGVQDLRVGRLWKLTVGLNGSAVPADRAEEFQLARAGGGRRGGRAGRRGPQPTNPPPNQPTNQPTNPPPNQPTNQPTNPPPNQPTNHQPAQNERKPKQNERDSKNKAKRKKFF